MTRRGAPRGPARRFRLAASLSLLVVATGAALAPSPRAIADDLTGADRLRVLWSNQMQWTPEGIPIVNVGVADGLEQVVIEGAAARLLPDGEGGSEVRGGARWTVRISAARPATVRWHVVVGGGRPSESTRLKEEAAAWRARGLPSTILELGTIFGLRGEVIDMRRLLVVVSPRDSLQAARAESRAVAERFHADTSVQAQVVERPRGTIEARDERGTVVRSDSVMWFAPAVEGGTLAIAEVPRDGAPPERREYAGRLYVTVGSDGRLAAANAVPEDRLLAGLLPAEIGAGAPPEALKAQAIAARNELYARMGSRHMTDPYRICSRAHCQVYAGAGHEDPRAARAVEATRGELLVRADGTLLDAVYSADCGGHTEDNDRAWATTPDPSLRGTLDADGAEAEALAPFAEVSEAGAVGRFLSTLPARPSCAGDKTFRWTARVDAAAMAERAGVGRVRELVVLERGVSGRVVKLRADGERGAREVHSELEVRRLLGGLKSALFVITRQERDAAGFLRSLEVKGGGHGHGVGLCQAGAIEMAARGRKYPEILSRYYRAASVKRFY